MDWLSFCSFPSFQVPWMSVEESCFCDFLFTNWCVNHLLSCSSLTQGLSHLNSDGSLLNTRAPKQNQELHDKTCPKLTLPITWKQRATWVRELQSRHYYWGTMSGKTLLRIFHGRVWGTEGACRSMFTGRCKWLHQDGEQDRVDPRGLLVEGKCVMVYSEFCSREVGSLQ